MDDGRMLCVGAPQQCDALGIRSTTALTEPTLTDDRAEKDRLSRAIVDAQSPGAAPSPITGLHLIDGAAGPELYVVTEKQTSVLDLTTNQLVSFVPLHNRRGCFQQRDGRYGVHVRSP